MAYNEQIDEYIQLLKKWNKSINLVQQDTMGHVYDRHIKDSAQICEFLKKEHNIIDIGSGAGLPGIVLAIFGFSNVVLCEKNFKKVVFLREVKARLNLNFEIFNDDICNFKKKDFISVSRAFSSLKTLLGIMLEISSTKGIFHKGESYEEEISEAKKFFDFNYKIKQSVTNNDSVIMSVFDIRRK